MPAFTETLSATTRTRDPEVVTVLDDGDGHVRGAPPPGATYATSTTTYPGTTITQEATTVTYPGAVRTYAAPPDALARELLLDVVALMKDVAPDVTSLPTSVASELNHDYQSLFNAYTSEHPIPTIFGKVNSEINALLDSNDPVTQAVAQSIFQNLIYFPNPTETASMASALSSLLAPYPSISSDIEVYLTAMAVWQAPELIAEVSMIRSDLSITTATPSWLSRVSAYLSTSTGAPASPSTSTGTPAASPTTTSSKGAAAPTHGASVFFNAGIAAAGMAVVGLL